MDELLIPSNYAPSSGGCIVHQTLHGYAEGHRLIESSLRLPDQAARLMLRMSDLSGGSVRAGFEEYLTGYPVEALGMYAFARTWYAPEMPRPGCVWTHTLLVPDEGMRAEELSELRHEFHRPNDDRSTYSEPFSWTPYRRTYQSVDNIDVSFINWLVDAFYFNPSDPLLIPTARAEEFQESILRFWAQQWPSLRKSLTFCTGALSARKLDEKFLQIQCIPVRALREIQLEMKSPVQVYSLDQKAFSRPAATNDCFEYGGGIFRKYLWAAAGEKAKRQDYAGFYRIYQILGQSPTVEEVLAELTKEFPSRDQAPALQNFLLGMPGLRGFRPDLSDSVILSALGSCERYEAIDAVGLRLKERASVLAQDFVAARSLIGGLFEKPLNPLGLEILLGFLSNLDSDVAREITQGEPRFLSILVKAKPSLAASPAIWRSAVDRRGLFESLVHDPELDAVTIRGIVQALLEGGADDLIRWAFSVWGNKAVSGALDWMLLHEGHLSSQCYDALTFQTQAVMDWLEEKPEKPLFALFAAANILAPYASQICRRETWIWDKALQEALERKDETRSLKFITFMLALGLTNAPPDPLHLVGLCFEIVHKAEAKERLPNEAWRYLEPLVPYALVYWDKCDRMRRGLVASFVRYGWPPEELRQRISNNRVLEDIFDSAKHVDGGKAYFKGCR